MPSNRHYGLTVEQWQVLALGIIALAFWWIHCEVNPRGGSRESIPQDGDQTATVTDLDQWREAKNHNIKIGA